LRSGKYESIREPLRIGKYFWGSSPLGGSPLLAWKLKVVFSGSCQPAAPSDVLALWIAAGARWGTPLVATPQKLCYWYLLFVWNTCIL